MPDADILVLSTNSKEVDFKSLADPSKEEHFEAYLVDPSGFIFPVATTMEIHDRAEESILLAHQQARITGSTSDVSGERQ